MITEQELKEKCTPEDIKKMVELAEEFEYKNYNVWFGLWYAHINDIKYEQLLFSLLIHRAVEGWNKEGEPILIANNKIVRPSKVYPFSNYHPCHLTQCEMAIWDCLLEVLC